MENATSYQIEVGETQLDDLRDRLRRTRWPERETVDDWSQGIPLAYVQEVCAYWESDYDWRRVEAQMNRYPQVLANVGGLDVHAFHVRSPERDALPMVMTHGWPGSLVEFLDVLDPLTNPAAHGGARSDAFHVVAPALPGFGFSAKPSESGWGVDRVADAWAELMKVLGYDHFVAQGGDRGARITSTLGTRHAERTIAIHHCGPSGILRADALPETEAERRSLERLDYYKHGDSGYAVMQSTRPQTVGYGLVDSPAAQAAWILEKFWAWTDHGGHLEDTLTRDQLLDNVMMYWLPGAGASSARSYWDSHHSAWAVQAQVTVPTGFTMFPSDVFQISRRWAEEVYTDIRYWSDAPRGGHFPAFEQPELFVDEVRACFRPFRISKGGST